MASRWQEYKEKNGVTPLDLLNPRTKPATEEVVSQRWDICKGCPFLIKSTSQCKKCGCFMVAKVRMGAAKCPIGNW